MSHEEGDENDVEQSFLPCTVSNVLQIFKETHLRYNLRILGSQLGLSVQDLDDIAKIEKTEQRIKELLDMCLQRGLLDWKRLLDVLKRPALKKHGSETVLKILSIEHFRRGSATSVQSLPLSPVSVRSRSDSHTFELSSSFDLPAEDGKATVTSLLFYTLFYYFNVPFNNLKCNKNDCLLMDTV